MTDRLKAFYVILKEDIRTDDAEGLINAIKLFEGVLTVKPITSSVDDEISRQRALHKLREKLWDVLK